MSAVAAASKQAGELHRPWLSVLEALARHRSIRRFRPDDVDPLLVSEVVNQALRGTSSYSNLNCVSVVSTCDAQRLRALRTLHFDQPSVAGAPMLLTLCADVSRLRRWLALHGAPDNFNNFHGFMISVIDTALLAQSIALGLESVGMGICFLGTTLDRCAEIGRFLELPQGCVPVTTLAVGHPDEAPEARDRLPLQAHLHEERYISPEPEQLRRFYARRDEAGWSSLLERGLPAHAVQDECIASYAQYCTSSLRHPPGESLKTAADLLALLEGNEFVTRPRPLR